MNLSKTQLAAFLIVLQLHRHAVYVQVLVLYRSCGNTITFSTSEEFTVTTYTLLLVPMALKLLLELLSR